MIQRGHETIQVRKATWLRCFMVFACGVGGCATKDPIPCWQASISRYVRQEGNGDLNVLREAVEFHSPRNLRPAQIRFDEVRIPARDGARYVKGVLLGQREANARHWYLFLVGVLRDSLCVKPARGGAIEDIRLIGCAAGPSGLDWRTGEANRDSVSRYQDDKSGASHTLLPVSFPSASDVYRLTISGTTITATEEKSSATWELRIPPSTEEAPCHAESSEVSPASLGGGAMVRDSSLRSE